MRIMISLLLTLLPYVGLQAHHNTQAEFGAFGSESTYIEANIVRISWGNPHVMINVEATGGELPVGERLRLVSHPINIAYDHGFVAADFAVGDCLRIYGGLISGTTHSSGCGPYRLTMARCARSCGLPI